jgi:hypothetical protein
VIANPESHERSACRPQVAARKRHQVTVDGGHESKWSRDGRQLFYRSGEAMLAAPVDAARSFSAGKLGPRVDASRSVEIGDYVRVEHAARPGREMS